MTVLLARMKAHTCKVVVCKKCVMVSKTTNMRIFPCFWLNFDLIFSLNIYLTLSVNWSFMTLWHCSSWKAQTEPHVEIGWHSDCHLLLIFPSSSSQLRVNYPAPGQAGAAHPLRLPANFLACIYERTSPGSDRLRAPSPPPSYIPGWLPPGAIPGEIRPATVLLLPASWWACSLISIPTLFFLVHHARGH